MSSKRNERADALIKTLRRQGAGRLTVLLGAAPRVGTTYAMLKCARELQHQGVDIVIAIVQTHGRNETSALSCGLPSMPRKRIDNHGRPLEEMDLDALLARHPQVALVDEIAHRNASGSRHERRWQDIDEPLDAGIDVYTTINIQHLESLNDLVHQITGIRVAETVSDSVFDRLRDIRLVDLPARELIERLNQGKVFFARAGRTSPAGLLFPIEPDGDARTPHAYRCRPRGCRFEGIQDGQRSLGHLDTAPCPHRQRWTWAFGIPFARRMAHG